MTVTCFDELKSVLSTKAPAAIVCVGNALRGDDGAGPAIYERIKGSTSIPALDAGTVPENYIQRIVKLAPRTVLIMDAVDFGGAAGDMRIFQSSEIPDMALSTHVLSLSIFAELIRSQCGAEVHLLGIQPASITTGAALTPAVETAVTSITKFLLKYIP